MFMGAVGELVMFNKHMIGKLCVSEISEIGKGIALLGLLLYHP